MQALRSTNIDALCILTASSYSNIKYLDVIISDNYDVVVFLDKKLIYYKSVLEYNWK